MSPYLLHPLPRRGAVVREQLRSTGLSLRREGVVLGGLLATFTLYLGWMSLQGFTPRLPFAPESGYPVLLLALLAPMAVWKGEDPAHRGYHWAMPVAHGEHAVARSLSGWGWMMAALGIYLAWVLGLALGTGGAVGIEAHPVRHQDHFTMTRTAVAGWRWAAPFTGVTILYLLGSALVLATRFPVRWLGGGLVGLMFVAAMRVDGQPNPVHRLVEWVWNAPLGLRTALSGKSPRSWGIMGPDFHFEAMQRVPSFGTWMLSTWLWLAIALSVFLFAAYRQPER